MLQEKYELFTGRRRHPEMGYRQLYKNTSRPAVHDRSAVCHSVWQRVILLWGKHIRSLNQVYLERTILINHYFATENN